MVIVLTGPTGVGKTDTGWALIAAADGPAVLLDSDWFAARVPFSWKREADVDSVFEAMAAVAEFHRARGVTRFVALLTLEMDLRFDRHGHRFERIGPVTRFRLACRDDVQRGRILARDRSEEQRGADIAGIPRQAAQAEALDASFVALDTTDRDEREVALAILDAARRDR